MNSESGGWEVDGMLNERIVATTVVYFDGENVTESSGFISFRV